MSSPLELGVTSWEGAPALRGSQEGRSCPGIHTSFLGDASSRRAPPTELRGWALFSPMSRMEVDTVHLSPHHSNAT